MEDARHADARARLDVADQLEISKAARRMHGEIEEMVNRRTEEILRATAAPVPDIEPDVTVKVDLMRYIPLSSSERNVPGVVCTCGSSKYHRRFKVLRTWADNHRNKKGHLFTTKEAE